MLHTTNHSQQTQPNIKCIMHVPELNTDSHQLTFYTTENTLVGTNCTVIIYYRFILLSIIYQVITGKVLTISTAP